MHRLFLAGLVLFLLHILPAQSMTLKIATIAPDGTNWMAEMRIAAKAVEEQTAGRVKLRFYPGGVMGNDMSVLRKIRVGQLHGGALTGGGLVSINPDSQIYSLPLMFRSRDEVNHVRRKMDPLIIGGLKENGFISFGLADGGFAYLMSQYPIDHVTELKTHKVWVPEGDEIGRTAMEALGVSPIPLPLTDVLTGLQTGLIDTVTISPTGAIALQWHSRVQYITNTPLIYLYGTLVIQERFFAKLSADDQVVVRRVLEQAFQRIDAQNQRDEAAAKEALAGQGIKFIPPNQTDLDQWRNDVSRVIDDMAQQGMYSRNLLDRLRLEIEAFRKQ